MTYPSQPGQQPYPSQQPGFPQSGYGMPPQQHGPPPGGYPYHMMPPQKRNNSGALIGWIIAGVVVLALIAGGIFFATKDDDKSDKNTDDSATGQGDPQDKESQTTGKAGMQTITSADGKISLKLPKDVNPEGTEGTGLDGSGYFNIFENPKRTFSISTSAISVDTATDAASMQTYALTYEPKRGREVTGSPQETEIDGKTAIILDTTNSRREVGKSLYVLAAETKVFTLNCISEDPKVCTEIFESLKVGAPDS